MTEYNGWKNRQTWNVAFWLQNDEFFYRKAVAYMSNHKGVHPYSRFIKSLGLQNTKTPDNVKWYSNILDFKSLNDMMWELHEQEAN